jgi:hypothetical protein
VAGGCSFVVEAPPSFVVGCPPSFVPVPAARSAPGIHPASSGSQACWQGLVPSFVVVPSWGGSGFHRWSWSLSFVVVVPPSFVGGSPLHSSWVVPPRTFVVVVPPSPRLSWFPPFAVGGSPSFVVGWPPSFVCRGWSSLQWLTGLGTGAGSFRRYGSAWGCCCR